MVNYITTNPAIVLNEPPRQAPITPTITKYPLTLKCVYFIIKKHITKITINGDNSFPLTYTFEKRYPSITDPTMLETSYAIGMKKEYDPSPIS